MKTRVRSVLLSVAVGVVLSAMSALGSGTSVPCVDDPPSPPAPPNPCSKPADGCSNPTQTGSWLAYCCKNTGASNCYWVEYRPICCSGTWKFGYRDGNLEASSCDVDHMCL